MAIEKAKGAPKMEWTANTLIQLGVALLLVLLSVLFCWLAFSNWRFKSNLVEGYQEYDRGRATPAIAPLEATLSWRPLHTGARELLAKIQCDLGRLDSAHKNYTMLLAQGYNVPQVHIGLGVIALKEAEGIDNPKQAEVKVGEAAAEFKAAGEVPEAHVGLGHCELVLGWKLNDPARYARAQAIFGKVRGAMDQQRDYRMRITRDGLIDYYTGLGKALASGEKYDEGAGAAFRACFQYTPSWSLPMANYLALEARRFSTFSDGNEALVKLMPDINALRTQTGNTWKSMKKQDEKEKVREQWMMYSLAVAQAWGRAGNFDEMTTILRDIGQTPGLESRTEPALLAAQVRTELSVKDEPNPSSLEPLVTKTTTAYTDLIQKLPNDDANKERRARAFNNAAWTLAWRGGYANNESFYTQAVQRMTEALRLYPDDYVYNRNMAIILKRFKRPPSAPAAFLEKCRAAVGKEKDRADDFEKLRQYIESK